MAIFSRSKKGKPTPTTPPGPYTHSTATLTHQPTEQPNPYQPNWTHLEQRTYASHGPPAQTQGWLIGPVPPQYHPVLAHQDRLPPLPQRPQKSGCNISKLNLSSMSNLLASNVPDCGAKIMQNRVSPLYMQGAQYLNQSTALCDLITSKFDTIITLIDGENFSGDERELVVMAPPQPMWQQQQEETGYSERVLVKGKGKGMVNNSVSSALTSTNSFAKVHLYANSRLPPNLPPLKLYMPTFPLLCLAAQYSERVYTKPSGQEKEVHLDADWRLGTKVVIKSVPMDDMNTIVFAIRGTQTFMDWAVNLNSAPASPEGFLDDPGNFCHAGFLTVARKMIQPVAARLRHLLQEDPSRSKCSLLITGHSAGGAVASLLYSHMLAITPQAESELNILTGCFKRIHCVSFGAPPVSLLPLSRPPNPALRKSIFLSFVNEGDPVPRADKAYVRSLLDLYSSPAPGQVCAITPQKLQPFVSNLKAQSSSLTLNKMRPTPKKPKSRPVNEIAPYWPVPEATLSNAGRIVLLRSVEKYENRSNKKKPIVEMMNEGVVAQIVTDELLRGVIWGDPVCHMMKLYARRIEILATNAVMGRF
ncbi:hypothetical protein ONS95_010241 [Cadophora gregata]|uniref:uncharacterized protein n=1 Tax=Cadophora gregata TaxID=51156 RepID=UPI0026DD1556|nr:uncharacterized protein ONS95_010241 [Cadophora gregata]KAK0121970.1 hypothetical protein ONS95_010241 [Cadophora gregata]KAK0127451.1 hypothetical protein ONS96_006989 [Cadophora gregata f. sp. sojae]